MEKSFSDLQMVIRRENEEFIRNIYSREHNEFKKGNFFFLGKQSMEKIMKVK